TLKELRRAGFVEGSNLTIERYDSGGDGTRYEPTAQAIVASGPDAILTGPSSLARILEQHTRSIPIVVAATADPIAWELTTSLARPDRNATGFTIDGGIELTGLQMQLLKEIAPGMTRVGFLTAGGVFLPALQEQVRDSARALKLDMVAQVMDRVDDAA